MNIPSTAASLPPQSNLVVVSPAARDVKSAGENRTIDPSLTLLPAQPPDRTQLEAATQSVRDCVKPINDNLEFIFIIEGKHFHCYGTVHEHPHRTNEQHYSNPQ